MLEKATNKNNSLPHDATVHGKKNSYNVVYFVIGILFLCAGIGVGIGFGLTTSVGAAILGTASAIGLLFCLYGAINYYKNLRKEISNNDSLKEHEKITNAKNAQSRKGNVGHGNNSLSSSSSMAFNTSETNSHLSDHSSSKNSHLVSSDSSATSGSNVISTSLSSNATASKSSSLQSSPITNASSSNPGSGISQGSDSSSADTDWFTPELQAETLKFAEYLAKNQESQEAWEARISKEREEALNNGSTSSSLKKSSPNTDASSSSSSVGSSQSSQSSNTSSQNLDTSNPGSVISQESGSSADSRYLEAEALKFEEHLKKNHESQEAWEERIRKEAEALNNGPSSLSSNCRKG